jgi:general stress protein 26
MSETNSHETQFNDYLELLAGFEHTMLATREASGHALRARPMEVVGRTRDGHVWFITSVDSELVRDITENPEVSLCFQTGKRFLSVSGTARATRDPDRLQEFWTEEQNLWFEKGIRDPAVILIDVVPTFAQYWDRSGAQGVKFFLTELISLMSGRTLDEGVGFRQGTVDFDAEQRRNRG